jgi:hypothetical protein
MLNLTRWSAQSNVQTALRSKPKKESERVLTGSTGPCVWSQKGPFQVSLKWPERSVVRWLPNSSCSAVDAAFTALPLPVVSDESLVLTGLWFDNWNDLLNHHCLSLEYARLYFIFTRQFQLRTCVGYELVHTHNDWFPQLVNIEPKRAIWN